MDKIMIGFVGVLLLAVVLWLMIRRKFLKPQVIRQYEKEVISKQKRVLNFEGFNLERLDNYQVIDQLTKSGTITDIQSALYDGRINMVELCLYYLTRMRDHQSYRAVISLNQALLEEAKAIDLRIEQGEREKLFGVVVLLKDNIAYKGLNTSAGSYALKELTTKRHATIAQSLLEEGALVIGKANLSEFSNFMSFPSSNGFSVLGGQTKNPYGKFDVGGSSSGSSVAVALNLTTVAIGSETSGSLIYPASQNSVVSLKPTTGLLSRDLIVPITEVQDTAGVISRNVSDLEKVFHAIVKPDQEDKATHIVDDYNFEVILSKNYLKGKVLGYIDSDEALMSKIVAELEQAGATLIKIELPRPKVDIMTVLNHGINYDLNAFLQHKDVISEYNSLKEIVEFYQKNKEYAPYGCLLLEGGLRSKEDISDVVESNHKNTSVIIDEQLQQVEAIVSISNELSGLYATCGYPALTVPAGYKKGQPYGVTFVGGFMQDQKLIEIAYAYEQQTMHRKVLK